MSTMPPPAPLSPPSRGGGTNKILLGCGIGCAALLVLLLIVAGVVWVKVLGPAKEGAERIELITKQNQAHVDAIAALDSTYPSAIGDDLDAAELQPSQVESYLAVRSALGSQAGAVAQARAEAGKVFDMSTLAGGGMEALKAGFGMMGKLFEAMTKQEEARAALLASAVEELEAASIGPTELTRMLEIVEWRFLQNEEALPVALTPSERADWLAKKLQVNFTQSLLAGAGSQMGASDRADMERRLEEAEERLDDLKALAEARTTLSPTTAALLESHRADLQNLPGPGVLELSMLSENANPMEAMQGFGAMAP